ncbi:MAG: hypothetical protein WCS93_01405 [Candidatus Delongbacteria bacterium]
MSMFSYFKFDDRTDPKIKTAARLSFLAFFGAAGWLSSIINFSRSVLELDAFNFGIVLTVNETAVIFGFIISILLAYISESRLLGILVAMAGTALILCAFAEFNNPAFSFLYTFVGKYVSIATMNMAMFAFLLSLSVEYFETTRDSLVKHSTDSGYTAVVMGKISAFSLLGTASGYFLVSLLGFLFSPKSGFFPLEYFYFLLYGILGLPLIVIGILSSKKAVAAKALKEHVEFIIRGKFLNFYILTFFTASLNIIMIFFGAFFLVDKFSLSPGFIGLIFLLHSALVFFLRAKATEIMKSKGEDLTMKIRYIVSVVFFAVLIISAFDFVDKDSPMKYVLLGILALYGTTTLFDNSIKSFISYFATPNEQRSNLVIYTRLNQIAKIIIPILTGWLWIQYGSSAAFALGAIFSAICLIVSFRIYSAYNDSDDGGIVEEG